MSSPTLAAGHAGLACAHAQAAPAFAGARADHHGALATRHLDLAMDALRDAPLGASLLDGAAGVGWAVARIQGGGGERFAELDDALLSAVSSGAHPTDLAAGLVGIGIYGLGRLRCPAGARIAGAVVSELAERAGRDEDGSYWHTPAAWLTDSQRAAVPDGRVDLGVAHGQAGIVAFLASCAGQGVASAQAGVLARSGARWMLARELPDGGFPYVVADGADAGRARLSWCYGELGIAAALASAAASLDDGSLAVAAARLASAAAARAPQDAGVDGLALCHGAAGAAALFGLLSHAEGCAEAGEHWLGVVRDAVEDGAAIDGHGLVDGRAGIACALLQAGGVTSPVWATALGVAVGAAEHRP